MVAGPVVVTGDEPGVLIETAALLGGVLQPSGDERVVGEAVHLQHAVVGDVAEQGVLEEELPRLVERRVRPLVHDFPRPHLLERVRRRRPAGSGRP